ncbi:MAG TPA: RagB/SusD family nutrient uptake outer membrane protein, partial [Phnomibacter sp.]|nr:RagB/SusD family nutrient uptake outer membrane protein [Phnomibacter sp.]
MKQTFIILTAFALMGLGSCKKDLLDTAPYDQLGSANMWLTDNLTDLGVNGIYQALRLNYGNLDGYEPYQTDMWSFTGQNRNAPPMMQGTILPNNALFSNYWRGYYEGVIRANDAIANIPTKSPSADIKKARLIAEAKFLRAYFYFKLNEMWRGVPLYLEPVNYDQFKKPRETEQAVWDAVIKDLTDAINEPNLPNRYQKGNTNFGRATKGAAYALRGKTYLYMGRWNEAAADLAKVEEVGHALFPNYRELFREANEQSEEMIFSVQNISVPNLGSSTQFYVGTRSSFGSCWNNFLVSPNLVDLYEKTDGSA